MLGDLNPPRGLFPGRSSAGRRPGRRAMLRASATGLAGLTGLAARPGVAALPGGAAKAKSTILFFLCGGSSHVDLWDLKPAAPAEYRGEFRPIATTAPGLTICEHLPLTAKQGHKIALVHGVTDSGLATGDHHAGYYFNLTGHPPDITFRTMGNDRRPFPTDWPHMAAVVGSRRPLHPSLPQTITLPYRPSQAPYTRPGQFAGRLGLEHDPFFLEGTFNDPMRFIVPDLAVDAAGAGRLADRRGLLDSLNRLRHDLDLEVEIGNYTRQQERTFDLLAASSTAGAFDIHREPEHVRALYGPTINGTSLLMARRLVEAGVPYITVFWSEEDAVVSKKCASGGGWDTHANNFSCLRENLLPEFDRAFAGLVGDLDDRGLLDSTLLLVSSEMGRKPKIGDPRSGGPGGAGRDHWTACMSVVMAGGGIRGGVVHGRTDPRGEYPEEKVTPGDVVKTVYAAMGIDNLEATDNLGRPYNLLDEGRALPIL